MMHCDANPPPPFAAALAPRCPTVPESRTTPRLYEHLFGCAPIEGDLDMGALLHHRASGGSDVTPDESLNHSHGAASMAAVSERASHASGSDGGSARLACGPVPARTAFGAAPTPLADELVR